MDEKENQDIYNQEFVEEMIDDDEINMEEAGFMQGYNEGSEV